jgi:hypothetical protein
MRAGNESAILQTANVSLEDEPERKDAAKGERKILSNEYECSIQ